ncbi:MAG: mannosyltransferase [Shinella sp.]|nr:MAG: mannosyltransferase [Shinella sp.]
MLGLPRKLHSAYLKLAKITNDPVRVAGLQVTLAPPTDLLSDLFTFDGDNRRRMTRLSGDKVPLVLHQIWLGTLPLPPATEAWRQHCKSHGMEYRLWREADLAAAGFDDHPSFHGMLARSDYPGAVDVARYMILEKFGGIYLDCDWYPARDDQSFADYLPLVGISVLAEDIPRKTSTGSLLLANSFIAAPAGHPVFSRIVEAMPCVMERLPRAPAWWSTGPLIFTLASRSTSICVAETGFVVANLPRQAPFEAVEAARQSASDRDGGLLIAWKSW